MRRSARNQDEAAFVNHIRDFLDDHLGEPEDTRDFEVCYQGYWVHVGRDDRCGIFHNFKTDEKGSGFDLLPLLDLSISDFTSWLRGIRPAAARLRSEKQPKSAAGFEIMVLNDADDDGRVSNYFKSRSLPEKLAQLVRMTRRPRWDAKQSKTTEGPLAMVSWATDDGGNRLAGQVLQLTDDGEPLLTPKGRKLRLTYKGAEGWSERSAFRIAAIEGHETEAAVLVEGAEDGLSVRAAGYKGPIFATLGKTGFRRFSPSCSELILLPDADVPEEEVETAAAFHVGAGRSTRVARLPLKDSNDMLKAGRDEELLQLIVEAETYKSPLGELDRLLKQYAFTDAGEARFAADVAELQKKTRLGKVAIRRRRRQLCEEQHKAKQQADTETEADADGTGGYGGTVIKPWPEALPEGPEVLDEVLTMLRRYVVVPIPSHLAVAILWSIHCSCFKRWQYTPRLYVRGLVPESGKTRLLDVLQLLIPAAEGFLKTSGAGLYRRLDETEAARLSLVPLIDEVDGMFSADTAEDRSLRLVFNNNDVRSPKKILLTSEAMEGRAKKIRSQAIYALAPMLFSGLDAIPTSMASRSIIIPMQRYRPEVRALDFEAIGRCASRLLRWTLDNAERFEEFPEPPDLRRELSPRFVDKWSPLLAIANAAGGDWPAYVHDAMAVEMGRRPALNFPQRVLLDVRRLFDRRRGDKALVKSGFADVMLTTELARELLTQETGRSLFTDTSDHEHAREQWLGRMMDEWLVRPRRPRRLARHPAADGIERPRGYFRRDLEDVWRRHGIDDAIAADEGLSEEWPDDEETLQSGRPSRSFYFSERCLPAVDPGPVDRERVRAASGPVVQGPRPENTIQKTKKRARAMPAGGKSAEVRRPRRQP